MTELAAPAAVLYEEPVAAVPRDWRWLPLILVIVFVAVVPVLVPLAALAWLYNVLRFRNTWVRVTPDELWVGKRSVRLCALELSTMGQAGNTWPWRHLNKRYLGANPVWTKDSVGLRGIDRGKRYWVAVGTNHRDELVGAFTRAIPEARARAEADGTWSASVVALPPAGWHGDPWEPGRQLRWWDGAEWTGWTAPIGEPPPGGATTPDPGPPPARDPGPP